MRAGSRGHHAMLAVCASLVLAGLVNADIEDAMPAFQSRVIMGSARGGRHCAPHEELCPVSPGSNELHCVDFTDPKTCGGCVSDGGGLDCTAVPNVFMHGCTARGQCTGCHYKKGGMEPSLLEPDYLTCSIVKTQPETHYHHQKRDRTPTLSYARALTKRKVKGMRPLAATIPQNDFAAKAAVADHAHAHEAIDARKLAHLVPQPGDRQLKPGPRVAAGPGGDLFGNIARGANQGGGAAGPPVEAIQPQLAKDPIDNKPAPPVSWGVLDVVDPTTLPGPPAWLASFFGARMRTLPLSAADSEILQWLRELQEPLVQIIKQSTGTGTKAKTLTAKERKKKLSNAERFRLKLPPVPPKDLVQAKKAPPFIPPGMDYTDEEIEALGLEKYIKKVTPVIDLRDPATLTWLKILHEAMSGDIDKVRMPVIDAIWVLLDNLATGKTAKPFPQANGAAQQPFQAIQPVAPNKPLAPIEPQAPAGVFDNFFAAAAQANKDAQEVTEPLAPRVGPGSGTNANAPGAGGRAALNVEERILPGGLREQAMARAQNKDRLGVQGPQAIPQLPTVNSQNDADAIEESDSDQETLAQLLSAKEQELTLLREQLRRAQHKGVRKDSDRIKAVEADGTEQQEAINVPKAPGMRANAELERSGTTAQLKKKGGAASELDAFEEHVKAANKAKVKGRKANAQPEKKALESLEKENYLSGEDIYFRQGNKPMMAGMAKARPDSPGRNLPPFKKK